ncbi:MAG: hypothetical protein GEU81_13630 [Nitriliruptorales bacterium]|nr:hypothetical protein [Nitriliruptorales bacterium]
MSNCSSCETRLDEPTAGLSQAEVPMIEEPYPVSTAVEVGSLVHPDWILEVECIAYIDDSA